MPDEDEGPDFVWCYVASLTRRRGWLMEFVLWELPYHAGLSILHADAVAMGHKTSKGSVAWAAAQAQWQKGRETAPDEVEDCMDELTTLGLT